MLYFEHLESPEKILLPLLLSSAQIMIFWGWFWPRRIGTLNMARRRGDKNIRDWLRPKFQLARRNEAVPNPCHFVIFAFYAWLRMWMWCLPLFMSPCLPANTVCCVIELRLDSISYIMRMDANQSGILWISNKPCLWIIERSTVQHLSALIFFSPHDDTILLVSHRITMGLSYAAPWLDHPWFSFLLQKYESLPFWRARCQHFSSTLH